MPKDRRRRRFIVKNGDTFIVENGDTSFVDSGDTCIQYTLSSRARLAWRL